VISHPLRCIFVHIQKTGGSSVRQALGMAQHDADKHRFAAELRERYGDELWRSYFKFAFVRNPWDRLVSWWEMIRRNTAQRRPMNGFQRYVIERASTFEEFVRNCDTDFQDSDGSKWIFRNQVDYLSDASGHLLVDFVGRFESLPRDFAVVAARLGLPSLALPHVNPSPRADYLPYYSPELRQLVAQRYPRDIAAFGYEFGAATPRDSAFTPLAPAP
jgi:hypothetical protein